MKKNKNNTTATPTNQAQASFFRIFNYRYKFIRSVNPYFEGSKTGSKGGKKGKQKPEWCKTAQMLVALNGSKKRMSSTGIFDEIKDDQEKAKTLPARTTSSPSILKKANDVKTKLKNSMRLMRLKNLGSKLVIT